MTTLSLCMIIRDEEVHLEECLAAARPYVDEIAILDTGSTDSSPEIAARWADVFDEFEWIDDFSAARNTSLDLASGDWILVLDADERIDPEGFAAIRRAIASPDVDGYILEHYNYSDEPGPHRFPADPDNPFTRGYPWYSTVPILRLFRRAPGIRFRSPIHEEVDSSIAPERRASIATPIHHYMHGNPQHPRRERVLRYLSMMEKELAHNPNGRLFGIAGASAMHVAKDYPKAAHYLLRAAELGYEPLRSLEAAAEASYMAGRLPQAKALYEEVYAKAAHSPGMCVNLANLAVRGGDKPRAIALLEEALDLGGLGPEKDAIVRSNIQALRGTGAG